MAACCSCLSLDNFAELRNTLLSPDAAEGAMLLVEIVAFEVGIEVAFTYLLR